MQNLAHTSWTFRAGIHVSRKRAQVQIMEQASIPLVSKCFNLRARTSIRNRTQGKLRSLRELERKYERARQLVGVSNEREKATIYRQDAGHFGNRKI